jgi:poly-gamma-glutamate synthesis protein (capsule biosynthesis protein)
MHRQLAFAAVERGADAIIGHHPHCVGGIEYFRGVPIVYSLGNWLIPAGEWFGQPLAFPPVSWRELALRWDPESGAVECHWFDYDSTDHTLRCAGVESAQESELVRELTPFTGMSHTEYVEWFRQNRLRRKGLPVYHDYRHYLRNAVRGRWVQMRHGAVKIRSHWRAWNHARRSASKDAPRYARF